MRQAARIFETIQLQHRIEQAPVPMDRVCGDYFRGRRAIGSKDRADIAGRIYLLARHHARLGWWAQHLSMDAAPRTRVLLCLALIEGAEAIPSLFSGQQHTPNPLTNPEIALLKAAEGQDINHPDMPDYVRLECPEALESQLRQRFGDHFEQEMQAMMQPADLTLRVNTIKSNRDDILTHLKELDYSVTKGAYTETAINVQGKIFLADNKAYRKGCFEIQDEGSQLIAALCAAQPKTQVLDYCAGSGGKTLALAASMNNAGRVVAMDNDTRRLDKARPRLRRAGIHNVEVRPLDEEKNRKWLRRQKGAFDCVLIDAPCGGSGTWRRNPDTRWRQFGPSIDALREVQADILDRTAPLVKPGGRLVYATCSILAQENEDQIKAFLNRHADFSVLPLTQAGAHLPSIPDCEGDYMALSPAKHQTDGFFAAVLIRRD